jgi:hypothetical protein
MRAKGSASSSSGRRVQIVTRVFSQRLRSPAGRVRQGVPDEEPSTGTSQVRPRALARVSRKGCSEQTPAQGAYPTNCRGGLVGDRLRPSVAVRRGRRRAADSAAGVGSRSGPGVPRHGPDRDDPSASGLARGAGRNAQGRHSGRHGAGPAGAFGTRCSPAADPVDRRRGHGSDRRRSVLAEPDGHRRPSPRTGPGRGPACRAGQRSNARRLGRRAKPRTVTGPATEAQPAAGASHRRAVPVGP